MKKISSLLSVLTGVFLFAQSTPLVINNFSSYDAIGRLATLPSNSTSGIGMYAAPNPPYGSFTIPSGGSTQYNTFDTAGTASYPISRWYVSDYINPNNNGNYVYNDPFITTVNALNEWAGYDFLLRDFATGNTVDVHRMGNPAINPWFTNSSTGVNSTADWFTITTPSGAITYLEIYDL